MIAYANNNYRVEPLVSPIEHDGELLNWAVINETYGTVEARMSSLPGAMYAADNLDDYLRKGDEDVPTLSTVQ